ncbi:excinuclease ABC subunit UvrC [Wandonia haliotis]|uniref:UvrABC system protein C n=1 Tax=Wandonia haliotis TaxID=574963 RepID=A0ABN1MSV4_9FLAO
MSNKKTEYIELILRTLPENPGVYQYFDESGKIIYVGKAKNLKKRVNSYFNKQDLDGKTRMLVRKIRDIQYIVVATEMDALLLENNLIKKYQPRYNIQLKDDKTYPWICVKNEAFPRIFSTRRVVKDGSRYYGPYPSGRMMHALLDLIRRLYPLRTCGLDLSQNAIEKRNYKVCLEYHIGNCKGPCEAKQTIQEYNKYIEDIHDILKGNISSVIRKIKVLMQEEAEAYRFEEAQLLKEKCELLENYKSKSTIVSPTVSEVDVFTVLDDGDSFFVNYLVIKSGAIIHAFTSEIKKKLNETAAEVVGFALPELRERFQSPSKEVLVEELPDVKLEGIRFFVPQRGDKKELLDLSLRNTRAYRMDKLKRQKIKDPEAHKNRILTQIQKDFRLKELPVHIECFDNSNFQGTNAVSACVVFRDGKPSTKDYRHFTIQTVEGPDDFASMEEAVYRRYRRLKEEDKPFPQLVVIDGGKGQLGSALKALERLNLRGKIPVVGIAKRLEEIFFPGDSLPLYLDKRSESLKVIQHMRNEAHRFGITHHRNKRSKNSLVSELSEIKGIGPKTYEELMTHFKSVKRIREASLDSLISVIGQAKAKIVHAYFNGM